MLYIKDIFKACVCSFCYNIYEENSIDENDFIRSLKEFLTEEDLQWCLENYTSEILYDIVHIDNVCDRFYFLGKRIFETEEIINDCIAAYLKTITEDKTINVEA